uniref:Uncharacterized protein n=1 Tax=Oryza meridionalis TaxID=40149 RepID=A0A0E0CLN2_9ORYZ
MCVATCSSQVDVLAAEPFKGNLTVVCLLEGADAATVDERWMLSFNLSEIAFFVRDPSSFIAAATLWFRLSTAITDVDLGGYATLASDHFLFTVILVKQQDVTMVEFMTRSGILTANRIAAPPQTNKVISGNDG